MQQVKISKNTLETLEFNMLLTLEQAEWYTQNDGFIPLPRKANKENVYVIFTDSLFEVLIKLKRRKVKRYRISEFFIKGLSTKKYIIVFELVKSHSTHLYNFNPSFDKTRITKEKYIVEGFYYGSLSVGDVQFTLQQIL